MGVFLDLAINNENTGHQYSHYWWLRHSVSGSSNFVSRQAKFGEVSLATRKGRPSLKPCALLFIMVNDGFFEIHFDRQFCPNVRR
jgi:hypothetical protein